MAGGVVVGLEPHDTPERIQWIASHSGLRWILVESETLLRKLDPEALARYVLVVLFAAAGSPAMGSNVALLADLESQAAPPDSLPEPQPNAWATLIYTSGTTGQPKGILYRHEQVVLAVRSILDAYPSLPVGSRFVCWLPLPNLFQRIMNITGMCSGGTAFLVRNPIRVMDALPYVRPDVFIGVPRFYEKLKAGMEQNVAGRRRWVRQIARWSIDIGDRYARRIRSGGKSGVPLAIARTVADALILSKLRSAMGGRVRFAVTGSAPTPESTLRFFDAIGLPLYEAYGMSECIVPVSLNTPRDFKLGTVGRPLPANHLRFADDGELLIKGCGVFSGYYSEDDRAEIFSEDGFYRSGDYAEIDADGFIRLKGRKSEIFKTSAGRRVSPGGIEAKLQDVACVDRAVVVGAGRKCLAAILTLDRDAIETHGGDRTRSAEALDETMAAALVVATAQLPEHERPAGYLVLTEPFTLEKGEITPNLKLRRKVIEERYASQIEALFERIEKAQARGPVLLRV
jgi:long-chain acyl-CoA synthetase